uniref:Uncharacterized protein n=1 Tax=Arundo donax TaxID=35708 RepID=A0A0A9BMQ1_ARUDO
MQIVLFLRKCHCYVNHGMVAIIITKTVSVLWIEDIKL